MMITTEPLERSIAAVPLSRTVADDWSRRLEAELPALRRYARALAANIDDANDLVQNCMTAALRARGQWRGEGSLRAWLMTILRRDFYRGAKRRSAWRTISVEALGDGWEPAAPPSVDPLAMRSMASALERLSDEQREVLTLVAVEGRSYAETADIIGAPIGTVMSRLSRAREKLRAAVGPM